MEEVSAILQKGLAIVLIGRIPRVLSRMCGGLPLVALADTKLPIRALQQEASAIADRAISRARQTSLPCGAQCT